MAKMGEWDKQRMREFLSETTGVVDIPDDVIAQVFRLNEQLDNFVIRLVEQEKLSNEYTLMFLLHRISAKLASIVNDAEAFRNVMSDVTGRVLKVAYDVSEQTDETRH